MLVEIFSCFLKDQIIFQKMLKYLKKRIHLFQESSASFLKMLSSFHSIKK